MPNPQMEPTLPQNDQFDSLMLNLTSLGRASHDSVSVPIIPPDLKTNV
jgi:hypothetical protein